MTFSRLCEHLTKIETTTKRLEMTAYLVSLLKEASVDEIDRIVYLSLGQLAPLYAHKEFGLAEKMVLRAIARAFDVTDDRVRRMFKHVGDMGSISKVLAENREQRTENRKLAVREVFEMLTAIAGDAGEKSQERKLTATASLLRSLDPIGAKFATRIILNKLRLGFSDKTVLDALSVMVAGDKSARVKLEAAYNVRPDVGWIAKQVKSAKFKAQSGNIKPALGIPVIPALCQRLSSMEEIVKKMGRVAVEPKWDGQRIQAHVGLDTNSKLKGQKSKVTVHLFTRSLEEVTPMFPDLVSALKNLALNSSLLSLILDGEIIGIDPKTGKTLPFQTMITRKRKYGIQEQLLSVPIRYMIFDVLFLNGKSLMNEPFSSRRKILETLFSSQALDTRHQQLSLAPQLLTDDPTQIKTFFEKQRDAGLEGIVAKKWDSPYAPGRTGFHWVKLKWEGGAKAGGLLDTVDCVVMGTYAGRGKRSSFGVGAFLVGVRDGNSGNFKTISKIGTGLSDEQWRELRAKSEKSSTQRVSGIRPEDSAPSTVKSSGLNSPRDPNGRKAESKPKEYDVPKELTPDVWLRPELVAEIQADNITKSPLHASGYALRFPRLVRYRTDKKPDQATTVSEVKRLYKLQKG